jgi:uncharacterized phage protein gp47/JayE
MVTIDSVTPAYGVSTKTTIIEINGTGFSQGTTTKLILQTTPPVQYNFSSVQYISDTKLRGTVAASSLPLGIYDVYVQNISVSDSALLQQCYRSAVELLDPYTDQTLPVLQDRIRSRMSLAPNGKAYDLRIGSTISDIMDSPLPEIEVFYNRISRVLKQGFAQYMGGVYLDLRCEEHGVLRKVASSSGVVRLTAPVGTILPTGMAFSTTAVPNSGLLAIPFTSTETASKIEKAAVSGTMTSTAATSFTDNTKNFVNNEWVGHYVVTTGGKGIGQIRKIISNSATQLTVGAWDTGQQPDSTTTYTLFSGVDVRADLPGVQGNVPAGAIDQLTSGASFITGVINPLDITDGSNSETDAQLLARFLLTVRSPSSGGNVVDYKRWAVETPGVSIGDVSVIPLWSGPGTVQVVVMNADGSIPVASTISAVQNYLDPTAGQGGGKAPIGAHVSVVAATAVLIDVHVTISIEPNFNPAIVRSEVASAIVDYLNGLTAGDDVIFTQLQYVIYRDPDQPDKNRRGVADYDILSAGHGVKLNSSGTWTTANVVLTGTQKARAGVITVD